MEKVQLTVSIEDIRLDALEYYLAKSENTTPQKELARALMEMYEKHVPEETRSYLDSKLKPSPPARVRPKRPAAKAESKAEEQKEEWRDHHEQ